MQDISPFKLMEWAARREGLAVVSVESVSVMLASGGGDGVVHYTTPLPHARISSRFSDRLRGIVLAHELGHVVDWRRNPVSYGVSAGILMNRLNTILKMPADHLTPAVMLPKEWGQGILQMEAHAWENGRLLASEYTKKIGEPVDWILWTEVREWALGSYRSDVEYAMHGGARRPWGEDPSAWDPGTKSREEALREES